MAIAYSKYEDDAVSSSNPNNGTFTLNAGTDRLIVIMPLFGQTDDNASVGSATFDSKQMKFFGAQKTNAFSVFGWGDMPIFYIAEDVAFSDGGAGGVVNYSVSRSGSATGHYGIIQFNGVDTIHPFESISYGDNGVEALGTSIDTIERNIHTHSAGSMVLHHTSGVLLAGLSAVTVPSGWSGIYDVAGANEGSNNGDLRFACSYKTYDAPSETSDAKLTHSANPQFLSVVTMGIKEAGSTYGDIAYPAELANIRASKRRYRP